MTYKRYIYNGSAVVNETKSNVNVRLLTEAEYIASGLASGYLNISDYYWLADIGNNMSARSVHSNGYLNNASSSSAHGVRPVIKITSDLIIEEGNGTITSPYTVSEERSKNTSNIQIGEYVNVPKSDGSNYLTRVVKNDSDGIKVILNGLYNISAFGSNETLSNTSTVYTGSLTSFKNTLDLKYFDSSNHQYNITMYQRGANWNNNTTMATLDIGLASIGEMFSGNDIDLSDSITKTFVYATKILNPTLNYKYWIGNSYDVSNVYNVYNYGYLESVNFNSPNNYTSGVRPVFMINSDMAITGGNGTANSPYTLK